MHGSEEVSRLPVELVPGLVVAQASSMWVTVALPGGGVVWWDGRSRAHIDLPQGYRGAVQVTTRDYTASNGRPNVNTFKRSLKYPSCHS